MCSFVSSQSFNILVLLAKHWGVGRKTEVPGLSSPRFLLESCVLPQGKVPFRRKRGFYFLLQSFSRQPNPRNSKYHQEKQNPLPMTNFVSGKGRDGKRTNCFLNFKDCTASSLFVIIRRHGHITKWFIISIAFAQKYARICSSVVNCQTVSSILFNFFPTFQYRISLTGLLLWLLFYIVVTSPTLR